MEKETLIKQLDLEPHIEGGWFKEVYANDVLLNNNTIMTSIYFLLDDKNFSAYHRLTSDEVWYFHEGDTLHISMIDLNGNIQDIKLGRNIQHGEVYSYTVPKGWIFGSYVEKGFALVSCVVAPGFTYEGFKLFTYDELISLHPKHKHMIKKLTRK